MKYTLEDLKNLDLIEQLKPSELEDIVHQLTDNIEMETGIKKEDLEFFREQQKKMKETKKYQEASFVVKKITDKIMSIQPVRRGGYAYADYLTKVLLKTMYDIDWKTSNELNPDICFD